MPTNRLQQKNTHMEFTFYYTDIIILKTELTNKLFKRYFVLSTISQVHHLVCDWHSESACLYFTGKFIFRYLSVLSNDLNSL